MVLTAHPVLRGWSPPVEDDYDVHIPDQMYLHKHFIASTSCITHQPMAPSSDRRAQRNRSRDPSWIPRPRNAFIIFRCEYSREHSQAAQDGDEASGLPNPTAKTLSKRAAEAWKQLSASDKERYKGLAEKEREEHARLYPHYRFRPMRRQVSGLRKRQCELSMGNSNRSLDPSDEKAASVANADDRLQDDGGAKYPDDGRPNFGSFSTSTWERNKSIVNPSRLSLDLDHRSPESQNEHTHTHTPSFTAITSSLSGWNNDSYFTCMPEHVTSPRELLTPYEEMERAQALEAYAIGLHHFDFFTNPLPLPEYPDPAFGVPCDIEYSALFPEQAT